MYVNPFQVSMDTIIGTSMMMGHRLEDRTRIREAQDRPLIQALQAFSTVPLHNHRQKDLFCVAPLDILVTEQHGNKQFHLLEINGTGIGGLTNLNGEAVASVLDCLMEMARQTREPAPVILVAISGKESDQSPRLNKLVHEKILYVEALKRGFEYNGKMVHITTMTQLLQDPRPYQTSQPTIVLGYIKDLLDNLTVTMEGRVNLLGRPVSAAINDRFCLNVIQHFHGKVDLAKFITMNRCFLAGADKGVAYELLNEYLAGHPGRFFPKKVYSERAQTREELIATVQRWLAEGRKAVIKPQGTGLGHGIEFFLSLAESEEQIREKVDHSLTLTEEYYHAKGGAFPYTICEYVDACCIPQPLHPLYGHKYEVRVVVYRDGFTLKAFPSIVKVASEPFNSSRPAHLSLINNITASSVATKTDGSEHMLPLCSRETLALLDLHVEHLMELCAFSTRFIRDILDKVQTQPERFGLPREIQIPMEVEAPVEMMIA
ncbi:MAG: hypothetical protein AB7P49_19255 [Bdellovibrionales bacterium]